MSNHKAPKNSKRSPEMQAAHLSNEIYSLQCEREFEEEYGNWTNDQIYKASHEMSILATKLLAFYWKRNREHVGAN